MKTENINIIVSDSNCIVKEALKILLQNVVGFYVKAEAERTQQVINLLGSGIDTDLVLMESELNDTTEEKAISTLKKNFPTVKIVILSTNDNHQSVSKAFKAGADGYLLKSVKSDELIFAIRHIHSGGSYLCSSLMKFFLEKPLVLPDILPNNLPSFNFTNREIEILTLISQGYTNVQISDKLFTSRRTIENHRQGLIDKTGSRNIVSLVRFAILNGLIS